MTTGSGGCHDQLHPARRLSQLDFLWAFVNRLLVALIYPLSLKIELTRNRVGSTTYSLRRHCLCKTNAEFRISIFE